MLCKMVSKAGAFVTLLVMLILDDNGDAGFNIDIGASNGECGALLGAVCLSC